MFAKKLEFDRFDLKKMANALRLLALDTVQNAGSGHPGIVLGFADVIAVLFANHLKFDPNLGNWAERDRFIMSAGHGSALLYAALHLAGYPITREDLRKFRKIGGLPGHPELDIKRGIEMTTGPLGQGFASAVGIAMARPQNKIYVAISDGDLMEGVALEAASVAGLRKLKNLIVLWDDNGICIDGHVPTIDDMPEKFRAMGWDTIELDGMSPREINRAIKIAKKMDAPVLLACKTIIGYGSRNQGTELVHGSPLEYDDAMRIMSSLTHYFEQGAALWKKLANFKINPGHKLTLPQSVNPFVMPDFADINYSTREMFNMVIKNLVTRNQDLVIGGSADLSKSTGSIVNYKKYIHYGVREHAMGAIMNGLALGGFMPYGGTFLVFSDYMRPAIRMAAIMNLPVLFVFSHDSIALGEDGPTHQPIEQLPSLRMIPNLTVYRPCNMTETFLCVKKHFDGNSPAAIILSRQSFPEVPDNDTDISGYIIAGDKDSKVKLVATGSEVALAMEVFEKLESKGIKTAVISLPSLELIDYEGFTKIIEESFAVWIEASAQIPPFKESMKVSINSFGESGKGSEVYKKYGFDADDIASKIIKNLKNAKV